MIKQKFKSTLIKMGSWVIAKAPFNTFEIFGTRKAVRIKGSIDGYGFKDVSLLPIGDGKHFMAIKKEIRNAINKEVGDEVEIILQHDSSIIEIPKELIEAFEASPDGKKMFYTYSPSHQRNYVRYITESKRKETREKRAVETVIALEKILTKKKDGKKN